MTIQEIFQRELRLRNYAISTIETYTGCLNVILFRVGDHPDLDHIKNFLLTIKNHNYHKQMVATFHRYFEFVLKKPLSLKDIPYPRKIESLPEILSIDEIKRLIDIPKNKKHQSIILLLYGCGLRVGEVLNLKMEDIDIDRMVLTVRSGKGNKDRQIGMDEGILKIILEYYNEVLPEEYLFNGQFGNQYSDRSINEFLKYYAKRAGITKHIHAHALRHAYGTHLHESGTDLAIIQKLMGHKNIKTTGIYTRTSTAHIKNVKSPASILLS